MSRIQYRPRTDRTPLLPANSPLPLFTILAICLSLLLSSPAMAAVSASYLSNSGRDVILQITISAPAPQGLIVEQRLTKGATIVSTNPPAKKIDNRNATAKWLFKSLGPGSHRIHLQTGGSGSALGASIRFRDPTTGSLQEFQVRP